jgi:hypothetical protein
LVKYLFGDSSPFPLAFDFLATLGSFMTAATTVVQLVGETKRQQEANAVNQELRVTGIKAVHSLNKALVDAIDAALTPPLAEDLGVPSPTEPHPAAVEHGLRMKQDATRLLEERRKSHKDITEREAAQLRAEQERRAAETRAALEQFFRTARLPVLSSRVTTKLLEGGHPPKNELCVVFRNQGDVVTSFVLGTGAQPAWNGPREVSDFVPSLDLNVGVKKAFFGGAVTPMVVHLADWIVSHGDVHDLGAEIALRRKFDQKDAFIFKLVKSEQGWRGVVERPEDPAASMLPADLSPEDLERVVELMKQIRAGVTELIDHREQMLRLELDGRDVIANALGLQLVMRLVKVFAPTVEQITARSPSKQELSLKKQHEDGRREEIYLRREELLEKLQPLNAEGRSVFAQLGLDEWVPQLSMNPPQVR